MMMPPQLAVELATAKRRPSAADRPSPRSRVLAPLGQSLRALAHLLTSSDQPRICQAGRGGDTRWQVYDPLTGRRASLASEDEVRQWLERRFYWAGRSVPGRS